MTFDLLADVYVGQEYGWASRHEVTVACRRCRRLSILKVELANITFQGKFTERGSLSELKGDLEPTMRQLGFLNVADLAGGAEPPDDIPPAIKKAFVEGARCISIGCFNAGASMFRLCLDLTSKPLMPDPANTSVPQPSKYERFNLGARIDWLMNQGLLPKSLYDLATCVRHDGNDAAHDGSLGEAEAADLLDFTTALLERLFTEPARLAAAEARRLARRTTP